MNKVNEENEEKIKSWVEGLSKDSKKKICRILAVIEQKAEINETYEFPFPFSTYKKGEHSIEEVRDLFVKLHNLNILEISFLYVPSESGISPTDVELESLVNATIKLNSKSFDFLLNLLNQSDDFNLDEVHGHKILEIKLEGDIAKVTLKIENGEQYQTEFGVKHNGYRLLKLLTNDPNQLFSYSQVDEVLKPRRRGAEESSDEQRARDTKGTIRGKLGIENPDVSIIHVNYGFKLEDDVKVIKS